jgi:thioesterase domain-containing protein
MARQLRRSGDDVAFLGLIDSLSPLERERPYGLRDRLRRARRRGLSLLLEWPVRVVRRRVQRTLADWHLRLGRPVPIELSEYVVEPAYERAELRYAPSAYSGPATLFRVTETHPSRAHLGRDLGWGALVAGDLSIVDVPGEHDTLMRPPGVDGLAARMSAALGGVSEATAPTGLAA